MFIFLCSFCIRRASLIAISSRKTSSASSKINCAPSKFVISILAPGLNSIRNFLLLSQPRLFWHPWAQLSLWLPRSWRPSWMTLSVIWPMTRGATCGPWGSSCTSCCAVTPRFRAIVAVNAVGIKVSLAMPAKSYSFTPSRTVISTFLRPSGRTSPMRLKTSSPSSSSRMPVNVFPPKWCLLTLGSDSVDHPGSWLLHKTSKGKFFVKSKYKK